MSSRFSSEMDNNSNTPTACFQQLCQVMLDGTSSNLAKKNIEDFRVILHLIMHDCSKANIETGKVWISEHCRTPTHATALMEYILSLSRSRKGQQERLHMIYLVSDILFHASRRHLDWMKESILSLLQPLLGLAYGSTETIEYKAKVMKVISLWGDSNIFEPNVINNLKQGLNEQQQYEYGNKNLDLYQQQQQQQHYHYQQPPPQIPFQHHNIYQPQPYAPQHHYQHQQAPPFQQQYNSFNQPPPLQQQRTQPTPPSLPVTNIINKQPPTPPQKPYFELPAGLMMIEKNEGYAPINPSMIKLIYPRPPPSKEILEALDDFYQGLDLSSEDDSILEEKSNSSIDAQGWEKGYLDFHFESIANEKKRRKEKENESRYEEENDRGRSRYDRRHSIRSRSDKRRSYSRSQSPPRRMSPPRSSNRGRRNYSPSRVRSPPRRSSPSGRGRSPIRRSSPPRDRYNRQRRYSRSRSPPPSMSRSQHSSRNNNSNNRGDFGMGVAPENRYLGLGNAVADEYDSFRRNKSQAYNRREPHQPMTCYKCNKVGHLARECQSL